MAAIRSLETERGGRQLIWEQHPEDASLIAERVETLLEDGLEREEAASIAVLNNRTLQAQYEQLGLAAADVVQAGLPANPTVRGSILFPVSAGESSLGIMAWLSDLWVIPRRQGLAELEARATELEVAQAVLSTAHEAIAAWDEVVFSRQMLDVERQRDIALRERSELVHGLYQQGLVSKSEWTRTLEAVLRQELAVRETEHAIVRAHARLAIALSLPEAAHHIPDEVALAPAPSDNEYLPTTALVQEGMARRLDLMESHVAVELAARRIDLEHALVWRSVSVGLAYEGDFESVAANDQNPIGPTIAIQIPIFDQNQAGIAAADFRLRQARKRLAAAYLAAREEIVTAASAHRTTADQLALIEGEMTDAVETGELHARERMRVGEGDAFEMLDAATSRTALEATRLRTIREFNESWLVLERAILSG